MFASRRVANWLAGAPDQVFSAWAIVGAFSTYFCMYGVRKPFAVGTFEGSVQILGLTVGLKILFIVSQVVGYCLSKFIGIKIISEMSPARRSAAIIACILVAWGALAAFAVLPAPWNALAMFVNGLPLGMVWGLVFGFLEGRRLSEVLGAGLSASYIVASGAVKTAGKLMMDDFGVSERWMPFVTGALFALPMFFFVWMLASLPPPSAEDERLRTKRAPMSGPERSAFFMRYAPGLVALTGLYVLLTAFRDFRDNFSREIWDALGYSESPTIMTTSELPIAAGVLCTLALIMAVKDNRKALLLVHGIMLAGTVLIGASTALWQAGIIGPAPWMILVGLGLYIGYVPYGCVLFDRLIAAVGVVATAGFLIYLTDAFGYLGSVALLLYKNFGQASLSWLDFFVGFCWVTSIVCTASFAASMAYFAAKTRPAALG